MIHARKFVAENGDDMNEASRPTIEAIASAVPQSRALQLAERNVKTLRDARVENRATYQRVIEELGGRERASLSNPRLKALDFDHAELSRQLPGAYAVLRPLRAAHAAKVTEALAPRRDEAGRRLLVALAEMRAAHAELAAAEDAIWRAGGDQRELPNLDMGWLENAGRRWINE